MQTNSLRRSIGLPLLTLYGLGTILGAGVYVLIGEVAGLAGTQAPSAFLLAALLAGVTAFSYAELSSRLPKSAGEAAYVSSAYSRPWLSTCIGWAVVAVGTVSAATMIVGFVGYLDIFISLPFPIVIVACVSVLTAIAIWGIGESLLTAAAITLLEVAGLLFVCIIAGESYGIFADNWQSVLPGRDSVRIIGVISGAFIAFYAFIGFEDMVNIAEEVREPRRNLPRAIIASLLISTSLYVLVAIAAVFALPTEELATSNAPLAVIVESRGYSPTIIAAISLFAVLNGALVQIIMASRVLYGLASDGLAFRAFARVNRRTQTPIIGTVTVAGILLTLSLFFSVGELARVTAFIALTIFAFVNFSLLRMKKMAPAKTDFSVPTAVPITGAILCISMIGYESYRLLI